MSISVFIKRHPVLTYFALTFTISWGGILIVIGPGGIPGTTAQIEKLFPIALMTLLVGPSVAGILLTGLIYGREGFREFLSRLLKWRVSVRWYVVALLATPFLVTVTLLVLSLSSPAFLPGVFTTDDKASLLLSGIAVGLMGGLLEELGWTGFAVPKLRLRYGVLTTGLIVGFLWGAWHFLVTFWASGDSSGALSLPLLLPPLLFYAVLLPVYRVLMVWVYDRTESLLVAILMHASLTASTVFILQPQATALVTYYLVLAAVLWIFVAVVAVAKGGKLSRHPIGLKEEEK
ncbi:MAG: CPBP family intramembrane metalloprotease [Methanophagales archaeon]|nr:CPBP family intramembrane metalloprotease [Methanophagales archaeon]